MQNDVVWQELAQAGLRKLAKAEDLDPIAIRSAVDIRLALSSNLASRPVPHKSGRLMFVTALGLGRGRGLRVYFERAETVTIWAIGPASL